MLTRRFTSIFRAAALAAIVLSAGAGRAQAQCGGCSGAVVLGMGCHSGACVAQNEGSGTVDAPHATCGFTGGRYIIRSGLPAASTIECAYRIDEFFDVCPPVHPTCYFVGPPPVGWQSSSFQASMTLWMQGTGALSNFQRTITIPVQCQTHLGPHTPGDPVQSFDTDMFALQGQTPAGIGDPDFDLLRITAGTGFGMRSPGHTTLTRMPGGNWAVDSFFDITYRIDFVGHPGGPLGGMSGSTAGEPPVHAVNGGPLPVAPMNPVGSCDVWAQQLRVFAESGGVIVALDGLPPGSSLEFSPHVDAGQVPPAQIVPGSIGGPGYQMNVPITLEGKGSGVFAGYERTFVLPHFLECHVGPINPGTNVQSLDNIVYAMQGQLPPGDPDFDLLRITAGNSFGMPSPGHTTLTRMPDGGNWAVDSFFDITYRIDFVGAPGGPFAGMSGSTTGTIRMMQGGELPPYQLDIFGLTHMVTGAAQMDGIVPPGDPSLTQLVVSNIGSSGQDGVSIDLTNAPNSGTATPSFRGLQGWSGEIDFGTAGALPPGMELNINAPVSIDGGEGVDTVVVVEFLHLAEANGGQATLAVNSPCDPACAGKLCVCCPNSPGCATLTVELWNAGTLMLSQMYSPPWPEGLVTGALGTDKGGPPRLLVRTRAPGADGTPIIEWTFEKGWPSLMMLHGNPGAVQATTIVVSYPLAMAPPMPNIPMPLIQQMEITGANVSSGGEAGVMRLSNEGVVHQGIYCVQYRESDFDFVANLSGPGDVDGDGRPDLVVSNIGSSGQDGVEFFNPCCDPFLYYGPLVTGSPATVSNRVTLLVLDTAEVSADGGISGGELPANAMLEARYKIPGDSTPIIKGSALRCTSGTCDSVEIHADFSDLGSATMRCEVYNNGTLAGSERGIAGTLVATIPANTAPFMLDGTRSQDDGVIQTFRWRQTSGPFVFTTQSGNAFIGDELRVMAEKPQITPTEILSMQLVGANICELAILDVVAVSQPPPPPCPADTTGDGTVNVNDLLAVINGWGACPPPCPPHCPADITHDCTVNVNDLLAVINNWGGCP